MWSSRITALRGDTVQALETGDDGESVLNVSDIRAVLCDRADLLAALVVAKDWLAPQGVPSRFADQIDAAIAKATGQ